MKLEASFESNTLFGFLSCMAAWFVVAIILYVCPLFDLNKKNFRFKARIVSLIHSILSTILCFIFVAGGPFNIGGQNTPGQNLVINVTGAYFTYDAIVSTTHEILNNELDKAMLLHHVVSISGCIYCLWYNVSGTELGLCTLLAEVSNPFMHLMKTFEDLNLTSSIFYGLSQGLFVLTYTVARILLAPILTWATIVSPQSAMLIKVEAGLMQVVSFGWFGVICHTIWTTFFSEATGKDEKKLN